MRRTFLMLAAAAGAVFLAAPNASAQTTIAQLSASYTPVGQLPAGTYGVTSASLPATFVVDLRAKSPTGQLLVEQAGAETKYPVEFYNPSSWTGKEKVSQLSLHFTDSNDQFVACTLARRDDGRMSGLCRDEAGRDGWLEVRGRGGESVEPGKWYGPGTN
ncbi:MAG: hypothetical protein JJE01_06090 [Gemmatimonadetes bacterium]|nr:hypothetical protein [Gemmatimonadota bacterium]